MAIARPGTRRRQAIDQLQRLVSHAYPDSRFVVTRMPDTRTGIAIWTYTSASRELVRRLVSNRELELLTDENIFVGVIPMPLEAYED